jgi:hypothetical protein
MGSFVLKDWSQPSPNKEGITRNLSFSEIPADKRILLAHAKKGIKKVAEGLYAIDDAAYFIKLNTPNTPIIIEKEGHQWLVSDIKNTLFTYQIVF